jgi:flagellar motor protein MotB
MTTIRWIAIGTLMAFPFLPSCYSDLKRRNEDLANQNHQLESELNQTKAERDESHAREEMMQKQVTAAREQDVAQREAAALRASSSNPGADVKGKDAPEAVKGSEKRSSQQLTAVTKKLSSSLANTKATVSTRDGRVCIALPLGSSFAPGSAELDSQGKRLVHEVGKILFKELSKEEQMFVVGHTDADPPKKSKAKYPDNHALSYARAKAVTAELKAVGIDTKRMIPSGAGESSPVAAGTSSKEKEKNRRVEIWLD